MPSDLLHWAREARASRMEKDGAVFEANGEGAGRRPKRW
jgi:hypothetical protein